MSKVIGFVPMRGGSKGIKKKNIKKLLGQPLCYYVLNALNLSSNIDDIYVSTDCSEIEEVVSKLNFEKVKFFRRSSESSTDGASSESAILEFIKQKIDDHEITFFFSQVTSPLLTVQDVDDALSQFDLNDSDSLLSAVKYNRFFWSESGIPLNYNPVERPRRQDMENYFVENGAIYISKVKSIIESNSRISGKISIFPMSHNSLIEIDEEEDFLNIEKVMIKNGYG